VSDIGFRMMAFAFKVRDFFKPRKNIVQEIGIKEGFQVLDYGCGPGGYVPAVAELVGESGKLWALDINPFAIKTVKKLAVKKHLSNVKTILSDCDTGLPDDSVDIVLLYDAFHDLADPDKVLTELHRVLKPSGILSFSDHHLTETEIASQMTRNGLFTLAKKGKRTYSFISTETD
jgi:ubiquinone/menaquinone biosynthesis C-methylase UbiE